MVRVRFVTVGREKQTWEEDFTLLDHQALFAAIKKKRALMSEGIDFVWQDDANATIMVGGFRPVGRLQVLNNVG